MKFKVIVEEDKEDGGYVVSVPSLSGCYSQGDTIEEALENIKEAIELYLEADEEELVLKEGDRKRVVEVVV
ncbi:MAG: type II toxin-antitoxin system HicB family antitoxin [Euryarchaeota archaeon]|nr:type II toxin-antitoxin system HicB family antitoxin [Euryarchaeota archaeon]